MSALALSESNAKDTFFVGQNIWGNNCCSVMVVISQASPLLLTCWLYTEVTVNFNWQLNNWQAGYVKYDSGSSFTISSTTCFLTVMRPNQHDLNINSVFFLIPVFWIDNIRLTDDKPDSYQLAINQIFQFVILVETENL